MSLTDRRIAATQRALPDSMTPTRYPVSAARTLEEVGAVMGFSRERARQVEHAGLRALRDVDIRARLEDLAADW
jgi:hypothetical protein